jgi:hypothetical protein
MRNTADVTGGKPIAVLLQSISGISAINPLVAFYDIPRGRCYSFILSRTPHETTLNHINTSINLKYMWTHIHTKYITTLGMYLSYIIKKLYNYYYDSIINLGCPLASTAQVASYAHCTLAHTAVLAPGSLELSVSSPIRISLLSRIFADLFVPNNRKKYYVRKLTCCIVLCLSLISFPKIIPYGVQDRKIAPLHFFHVCRNRRLKEL